MEYRYSHPVDASTLASRGCFTLFPVRKSNYESLAVETSHKVFEEYNLQVGKADITGGVYDPRGHAVSLSYPESMPERIDIATQMQEIGFLHDDLVDSIDLPAEAIALNHTVADSYGLETNSSLPSHLFKGIRGKRQMEAKMYLQAIAIDRDDAFWVMKQWVRWLERGCGLRIANDFKTFEEWMPYRYEEGGILVTFEIARFVSGVKITNEERLALEPLVKQVEMVTILTNDYYSYEKEYAVYVREGGVNGVHNSVWVLMREHNVDKTEAKRLLAQRITAFEQRFLDDREAYTKAHPNMSPGAKAWLDVAVFVASGSHFWSTYTSRYHRPEALDLTPRQQNGTENGTTQSTASPNHVDPVQTPVSHQEKAFSFTDRRVSEISTKTVLAPYEYLISLGSKGIRQAAIEALNIWLDVPEASLTSIRNIVDYLHSSSLMLDDIEDQSALRRGSPATHLLFGEAQTINSANFLFVLSLEELHKLRDPQSVAIYNTHLRRLHIGQSMDLYWTRHVNCPTLSQYVDMVDHKTADLFNLVAGLMQVEASCDHELLLNDMMILIGRYFQIRDDYSNLVSADYSVAKGFCEDLDEGKFSLPLIHALKISQIHSYRLQAILQERRHNGGGLRLEMKELVLKMLRESGSLEYVRQVLKELEDAIDVEIQRVEAAVGEKNYVMRLLLERLRID